MQRQSQLLKEHWEVTNSLRNRKACGKAGKRDKSIGRLGLNGCERSQQISWKQANG